MEIWIFSGLGGGAEPPEASENIKKSSRKINGKRQKFETFHEILANFDLKKRILIKIKAILMEFWKALIILKEIKKPSDKFLRVLAKNQLRFEMCWENFEIYI